MPASNSSREDALTVVRRLRDAGHVAYFAGGCVRDVLLGREPKDYDVATDAPPERVRELFRNSQAVGAAFGVILVRHHGSQIEVATFRADGAYADGRRPTEVRFTTAEEDAKRRDFTINGLFYDPVEDRVIDYVGGQEDLKHNLLRAIGDPEMRFEEDHLRLLRAVRFATRFGLTIEPATADAIPRHAGRLARISPERIADELRAMLVLPTRPLAWAMLERYGLNAVIFRFLKLPWDLPAAPSLTDAETLSCFCHLTQASVPFGMALAAATLDYVQRRVGAAPQVADLLARPVVLQMVKAVRQALRISNEETEAMQGTLEGLGSVLLPRDELPPVATLKRFLARPTASLSRELLAALAQLYPGRWKDLRERLEDLEQTEYAPTPLITGDDLTAAGLKPGPVFKRVLDEVYDEQLEGRVSTREQAMEVAIGLAGA